MPTQESAMQLAVHSLMMSLLSIVGIVLLARRVESRRVRRYWMTALLPLFLSGLVGCVRYATLHVFETNDDIVLEPRYILFLSNLHLTAFHLSIVLAAVGIAVGCFGEFYPKYPLNGFFVGIAYLVGLYISFLISYSKDTSFARFAWVPAGAIAGFTALRSLFKHPGAFYLLLALVCFGLALEGQGRLPPSARVSWADAQMLALGAGAMLIGLVPGYTIQPQAQPDEEEEAPKPAAAARVDSAAASRASAAASSASSSSSNPANRLTPRGAKAQKKAAKGGKPATPAPAAEDSAAAAGASASADGKPTIWQRAVAQVEARKQAEAAASAAASAKQAKQAKAGKSR